jgi:antitoxin component YwqK of YwqJK toxin-antitoxin module
MKKLLLLLSLTLFLSQSGYSYSPSCPTLDLLYLPPYPPILTPPNFLDLTEDELNEFMKLEKENLLLQKEWEEIAEKNKIKRDRWRMGSETGEYDSEGNKHGFWTYSVPANCGEYESGTYIHGKRQGEWSKRIGLIVVRSTYKDDKLHGLWTSSVSFFGGKTSGNYKNGKKDGKWTKWDENGQIKSERNYKDDECISGDC